MENENEVFSTIHHNNEVGNDQQPETISANQLTTEKRGRFLVKQVSTSIVNDEEKESDKLFSKNAESKFSDSNKLTGELKYITNT